MGDPLPTICTVGHSTRPADDFLRLLLANRIEALVDVRSYPGSRRYPQFNRAVLERDLLRVGIAYHHLPSLGGRRQPHPSSTNTAWQNAAFRAYADHMDSNEFKQGIAELVKLAREKRTTIMCAEAVWWSCHRSLISDYLKADGAEVIHIISETRIESHPYTTAARISEGKLTYRGLLP